MKRCEDCSNLTESEDCTECGGRCIEMDNIDIALEKFERKHYTLVRTKQNIALTECGVL